MTTGTFRIYSRERCCIVAAVLCLTTGMVRWVGMRRHDWVLVLSGATAGVALILMVERLSL